MPSDPAVPIPDSGPDEAGAPVNSPARRRRFALRWPEGDAVRTLHLLLIGSLLAPLLVLVGGGYSPISGSSRARADLAGTAVAEENLIGCSTPMSWSRPGWAI
jgi:hypothetical protein